MQVFDKDQLHYIAKGQVHQKTLRNQINEALQSNQFKANFIISSMPGLGKSYEMSIALEAAKLQNPNIIKIEGNASMPGFILEIATAVYVAKLHDQPLVVVLDDCDVLFQAGTNGNANTTKKMFDDARVLKYGKLPNAIKSGATPLQKDAIEEFSYEDKVGFEVPLNNATFIILTNQHLPTVNEVQKAVPNSPRESSLKDLHAIRRRTEYKEIEMNDNELWGYVANVVINEKICEKFKPQITDDEKHQLLTWCYNNWRRVTERNLSLIEKMTKDMVRYPIDYLDIWATNYL
jgi:hypothetical protein